MYKTRDSKQTKKPLMINLGCGDRVHPDWVNLDYSRANRLKVSLVGRWLTDLNVLSPAPLNYKDHDLRKGIPYDSKAVEYVYCSHVLEHIDRAYVQKFVAEIFRVLRPGGICRVVVPDLEKAANDYLRALEGCRDKPESAACQTYDHVMLELFDQFVRTELGGEKGKLASASPHDQETWLQRFKRPFVRLLLPNDPAETGELHRWMYDDYSLVRLLRTVGFARVKRVHYNESDIPDFAAFYLDNELDGSEYKPGSLYVEATKPSN